MSAKTVTDKEDGREAVLRAMQEAAENAPGAESPRPYAQRFGFICYSMAMMIF